MKKIVTRIALAACATSAHAGTDTWFTPLTESASVHLPTSDPNYVPTANSEAELTQPWVTPAGINQKNIVSLREVEDEVLSHGQSIVRVPGLGSGASMFDMIAYDPTGNFLFIPHETSVGAGITRFNLYSCEAETLFSGDYGGANGDWSNDYGAFDPARFTPNGTVITGEEWSGQGRVIEVMNPYADPEDIEIRELDSIANVAHEGIMFSKKYNDTIYFVDENNSGSIYKFVMSTPGVYTVGQTFVLSVDDFITSGGIASENWNSTANSAASRVGEGTWVPLTDAFGTPLTATNPFDGGATQGRSAADEISGTPYGRPEDAEVGVLANGNEVLYVATTSEQSVYSFEMKEVVTPGYWSRVGRRWTWIPATLDTKIEARVFCSDANTPKNLGYDPTTAVVNSPDNLAQDALGNIYVIEDAPNGSDIGGDIWFARDVDGDGVAESNDHFMSIRVDGAEATGMIWNPAYPEEFVISVQHPDSTNLDANPSGLGDAVWMFNVTNAPNQAFVNALRSTSY